jgi:hypothetical protein
VSLVYIVGALGRGLLVPQISVGAALTAASTIGKDAQTTLLVPIAPPGRRACLQARMERA